MAAATARFRRHGPGGTGVGPVCAGAGVTKGVFSHHFPGGKEELVAAVVSRNADQVDALWDRLVATLSDPADVVAAGFDAYADLLAADPDLGCPVAAAVVDASAGSEAVRAATAAAFGRWQDRLAELLVDHGHPPAVARDRATAVVAAVEGAILVGRARRDPDVLRRAGRALRPLLAPGAAAGPAGG